MSKRRKHGDEVWLSPNSGFTGESAKFKVRIIADERYNPTYFEPKLGENTSISGCVLECGDEWCGEWPNVEIVDVTDESRRHLVGHHLCHVSECEMHDEPQTEGKVMA